MTVDLSGGTPVWVARVPPEGFTAWIVTYNDGRIDTFLLDDGSRQVVPWTTTPDHLPSGAPPLLVADEGRLELVTLEGSSPLTHPVRTDGGLLGVAPDGRLFSKPYIVRRAASGPSGGCRWTAPSPPTSPPLPTRKVASRWP